MIMGIRNRWCAVAVVRVHVFVMKCSIARIRRDINVPTNECEQRCPCSSYRAVILGKKEYHIAPPYRISKFTDGACSQQTIHSYIAMRRAMFVGNVKSTLVIMYMFVSVLPPMTGHVYV